MRRDLAELMLRECPPPVVLADEAGLDCAIDMAQDLLDYVRDKGATAIIDGVMSFGRRDRWGSAGNSFELSSLSARMFFDVQRKIAEENGDE